MENLEFLVDELRKYENETNWFEFKSNNYDPDMIGKDIAALANGAAYADKNCAYMIWGIDDKTHEIIGTDYDQHSLKQGNEEIESWLRRLLSSNAEFEFRNLVMKNNQNEDKAIVVLIIHKASNSVVTFKKVGYIRVGSYKKNLNDYT